MKRNYRCVDCWDYDSPNHVKCHTFSTFEKAEKFIYKLIEKDGFKFDHTINLLDEGWMEYVCTNHACYTIVDIAKRDEINATNARFSF